FCCVYTLYTLLFIFSFTPTATSVFYTLSLHDALPILFNPWGVFLRRWQLDDVRIDSGEVEIQTYTPKPEPSPAKPWFHIFLPQRDRKSTRLNSSHLGISYAVFCLKKKKTTKNYTSKKI